MADTKISALTALTGTSVDTAADSLAIVDDSVTTTKKILVEQLRIAVRPVLGTPATTTSGTEHDFTGIPAGTRRITINCAGVSLSGTDDLLVQLGDSGGFESTGYTSDSADVNASAQGASTSTAGFVIRLAAAGNTFHGSLILSLLNSSAFTWVGAHAGRNAASTAVYGGGSKSLSAELTQVRITRTGTNTFDAGSLNILYE